MPYDPKRAYDAAYQKGVGLGGEAQEGKRKDALAKWLQGAREKQSAKDIKLRSLLAKDKPLSSEAQRQKGLLDSLTARATEYGEIISGQGRPSESKGIFGDVFAAGSKLAGKSTSPEEIAQKAEPTAPTAFERGVASIPVLGAAAGFAKSLVGDEDINRMRSARAAMQQSILHLQSGASASEKEAIQKALANLPSGLADPKEQLLQLKERLSPIEPRIAERIDTILAKMEAGGQAPPVDDTVMMVGPRGDKKRVPRDKAEAYAAKYGAKVVE